MTDVTRRQFLASLAALGAVAAPCGATLVAQSGNRNPAIRVRSLNHFRIAVSDPARTIDFYQGLFGMPVQARIGSTTILRVGAGPQFLSIQPVEGNASPGIVRYGLGVENFNVDRIMATLVRHGVATADVVGPMTANAAARDGS